VSVEKRLADLGLTLPDPFVPPASFVTTVRTGNLVFVSGHGPVRDGVTLQSGRVPSRISVAAAKDEARLVALNCLASVRQELGSLDEVTRVVKLLGMVSCDPGFTDHPQVINGASDLLVELFRDAGQHARSAVGVQSLPGGIAVEIEMIVEV
jgi:enamine deaminase RidA (YjgF/YER057c/UK114 family)